jgi:hypothetical protein
MVHHCKIAAASSTDTCADIPGQVLEFSCGVCGANVVQGLDEELQAREAREQALLDMIDGRR